MRLMGLLAFILLSTTILSYGMSGVAFADSHNIPPLSVTTDTKIYANGGTVVVTGNIRDYDSSADSGKAITFILKSPENNLVTIGQFTPKSDGTFERTFIAGGPLWKINGDYTLELHFGSNEAETKINYVGGEAVISKPKPPVVVEPPAITEPDPEPPAITEPDPEPPAITEPDPEPPAICGAGTELDANGICVISQPQCPEGYTMTDGLCVEDGGGCLIATATYGTELAPQVQLLREIRDNTLFSTTSGTSFMSAFNTVYYSFAPTVADWERESPMFKEVVKTMITPMLSTLSIMSLADEGSEVEVLGLGISVIVLNLGMYIAAPALIGIKVHNHIKSRK